MNINQNIKTNQTPRVGSILPRLVCCLLVGFFFCSLAYAEVDLSIISQIESSNNPLAYNKTSKATGLYQITPICLKDYLVYNSGAKLPKKGLFCPKFNKRVAEWYFNIRIPQLLRHYGLAETIENICYAYNMGIGNLVKYRRGERKLPQETKDYLIKYRRLSHARN